MENAKKSFSEKWLFQAKLPKTQNGQQTISTFWLQSLPQRGRNTYRWTRHSDQRKRVLAHLPRLWSYPEVLKSMQQVLQKNQLFYFYPWQRKTGSKKGNSLSEYDFGKWGDWLFWAKLQFLLPMEIQKHKLKAFPETRPIGKYGGSDAADNSGILKYVSIRHGEHWSEMEMK